MRVGLDTNLLVYAEGIDGSTRQDIILGLISRMPMDSLFVSTQALGELYQVLIRKGKRTRAEAREAALFWSDAFATTGTSVSAMFAAMDLAVDHQLSLWDALVLSVAAEAGCRLVLSEDFQDGFTWRGVTVTNPFAKPLHPLLLRALGEPAV